MRKFVVCASAFLLSLGMTLPAVAATTTTVVNAAQSQAQFTFQQAVDQAKKSSKSLRTAQLDVDRSYEVRNYLGDSVKDTYQTTSQVGYSMDQQWYGAFMGLSQADVTWRMNKRNLEAQEDSIVMQTYQLYNGLIQAQDKVKNCKIRLTNAQIQYNNAFTASQVGTIDNPTLVQAKAARAASEAALAAAESALDDAYQKFNILVGLKAEERPVLLDNPTFEKMKTDDVDFVINKAVNDSPTVWLAEKKVDLAEAAYSAYSYSLGGRTEPGKAKSIDIDKAAVSASSTKEQMEKLVRTIYHSIQQLEEQYGGAQQQVAVADENLRVVKVKFDIGMATKADVAAAESKLVDAKESLLDIVIKHQNMVYAFQKPWAYAASSS
ncbi:TolC family protein [Heliobacterium gestii]|uniref:TolC family protein n=1 Tax=Heliomicrobium gestii TaxID=2699 RepID=A0A845L8R1_HELGE|nr:TolC family protein [Heliomicrobium gestii]MBM7866593.1 outer membrane protein TolC [Heliomicrobium gestii]MZP43127.1 TolC family protein [Heliomicrobium gestii]